MPLYSSVKHDLNWLLPIQVDQVINILGKKVVDFKTLNKNGIFSTADLQK